MALIQCPECGAQVSSAAPACPQCGYPVSSSVKAGNTAVAEESPPTTTASSQDAEATSARSVPKSQSQPEPPPLLTERSAEPFSFRGRRIPVAAILFWGGLVVGMGLSAFSGEDGETPFRIVPYAMVIAGALWFSVTELTLLVRHRQRRQ